MAAEIESPDEGSQMSQQVNGVIVRSKDAPVERVAVNLPDPGPGEAVVQVQDWKSVV